MNKQDAIKFMREIDKSVTELLSLENPKSGEMALALQLVHKEFDACISVRLIDKAQTKNIDGIQHVMAAITNKVESK